LRTCNESMFVQVQGLYRSEKQCRNQPASQLQM
jgi:hypothetical protein